MNNALQHRRAIPQRVLTLVPHKLDTVMISGISMGKYLQCNSLYYMMLVNNKKTIYLPS